MQTTTDTYQRALPYIEPDNCHVCAKHVLCGEALWSVEAIEVYSTLRAYPGSKSFIVNVHVECMHKVLQ